MPCSSTLTLQALGVWGNPSCRFCNVLEFRLLWGLLGFHLPFGVTFTPPVLPMQPALALCSLFCCAVCSNHGSDATVKNLPPPAPSHPSRARNPLFKLFAVLWVSNYSDCSVYPCLQPVSVWSLGRRSPAGWLCTAQLRLLLLPTQRLWVPVKCFMNLFPKTLQVKTRARTLAFHKAFC